MKDDPVNQRDLSEEELISRKSRLINIRGAKNSTARLPHRLSLMLMSSSHRGDAFAGGQTATVEEKCFRLRLKCQSIAEYPERSAELS